MLFSFSDRSLHKTVPSPETSIERSLPMIILKILGEMARTPCTKYARYSLKSSGLLLVTCIQHQQQCELAERRGDVLPLSVLERASGTRLFPIAAVGLLLLIDTGDLKPFGIPLH